MACAANYAWVNRSSMTFLCRQAFAKLFKQAPDDLDMNVVYDVSHNIAKVLGSAPCAPLASCHCRPWLLVQLPSTSTHLQAAARLVLETQSTWVAMSSGFRRHPGRCLQ